MYTKEMNNFIITQKFGNTAIECFPKKGKNMENDVLPEILNTIKDENICAAFISCDSIPNGFVIKKEDSFADVKKIYHTLIILNKEQKNDTIHTKQEDEREL